MVLLLSRTTGVILGLVLSFMQVQDCTSNFSVDETLQILKLANTTSDTIQTEEDEYQEPVEEELPYDEVEIKMLEAVVAHESEYCSPELKTAIVDVVINRVEDEQFPDTISEVLSGKNQFTAIHNYYDNKIPPSEDTSEIVLEAISDEDITNGALYFCNHDYIYNQQVNEFFYNKDFICEIDGVSFYK